MVCLKWNRASGLADCWYWYMYFNTSRPLATRAAAYSCIISLFTAAAFSGKVSARQSPAGAPAAAQVSAHGGRRDVGRPDARGMGPRYSESAAALS